MKHLEDSIGLIWKLYIPLEEKFYNNSTCSYTPK